MLIGANSDRASIRPSLPKQKVTWRKSPVLRVIAILVHVSAATLDLRSDFSVIFIVFCVKFTVFVVSKIKLWTKATATLREFALFACAREHKRSERCVMPRIARYYHHRHQVRWVMAQLSYKSMLLIWVSHKFLAGADDSCILYSIAPIKIDANPHASP